MVGLSSSTQVFLQWRKDEEATVPVPPLPPANIRPQRHYPPCTGPSMGPIPILCVPLSPAPAPTTVALAPHPHRPSTPSLGMSSAATVTLERTRCRTLGGGSHPRPSYLCSSAPLKLSRHTSPLPSPRTSGLSSVPASSHRTFPRWSPQPGPIETPSGCQAKPRSDALLRPMLEAGPCRSSLWRWRWTSSHSTGVKVLAT